MTLSAPPRSVPLPRNAATAEAEKCGLQWSTVQSIQYDGLTARLFGLKGGQEGIQRWDFPGFSQRSLGSGQGGRALHCLQG